jgi:acyl-CoA reductase-like NAD-dependent aldehyde dehydrogenase
MRPMTTRRPGFERARPRGGSPDTRSGPRTGGRRFFSKRRNSFARADELAATPIREAGKPRKYARIEVSRAAGVLTVGSEEAKQHHGETQ